MSITMMKPATALFLALLLLPPLRAAEPPGAPGDAVVTNGTDWVDADGRPIMAHEGDLARSQNCRFCPTTKGTEVMRYAARIFSK